MSSYFNSGLRFFFLGSVIHLIEDQIDDLRTLKHLKNWRSRPGDQAPPRARAGEQDPVVFCGHQGVSSLNLSSTYLSKWMGLLREKLMRSSRYSDGSVGWRALCFLNSSTAASFRVSDLYPSLSVN